MGETLRINISIQKKVLEELRKLIAPRKRSEFIAEATKEKLTLLKQQKALEKAAGAWNDANHSNLNTSADMEIYLRETRGNYETRIERYSKSDD